MSLTRDAPDVRHGGGVGVARPHRSAVSECRGSGSGERGHGAHQGRVGARALEIARRARIGEVVRRAAARTPTGGQHHWVADILLGVPGSRTHDVMRTS